MNNSNTSKRPVHLVGSIPLENTEEVFRTTSSILGDHLPRIPDGETGNRLQWIMFQFLLMTKMQEFEVVGGKISSQELNDEIQRYGTNPEAGFDLSQRQLQVKGGVKIENITFPALGYAEEAIKSYNKFKTLKGSGEIHKNCRFQISLPTPLAPIQTFFFPKGHGESIALYNQYKKAMLNELRTLTHEIPAEDLAIQWDVCIEVIMLENRQNDENVASWHTAIYEELCSLAESVPEPVEVGYHFCYGDMGHKHFFEPVNTELMAKLANTISQGVKRTIQWFHIPVPRDRIDVEYYQPLTTLQLKKETRLFLGLVHYTDGLDGTVNRINAALPSVSEFGIATECGMGRRDPATIPELLELHLQAASRY